MHIQKIENETLIRIPNTLLKSAEVQSFILFLETYSDENPSKTITKARDKFEILFQKWKSETALLSSATAIVSHFAYRQIIEMGEVALPFMLIKLQQDPQHLFYALYHITGENPVSLAHAGNLKEMTADWLHWGQKKGYIN